MTKLFKSDIIKTLRHLPISEAQFVIHALVFGARKLLVSQI